MADQTNAEVSDERLRELIDSCKGVTPGPWEAIEEPYNPESDLFCRSIYSGGYKGLLIARADQDFSNKHGAYLARLDPQTIRSLVEEVLINRARQALRSPK